MTGYRVTQSSRKTVNVASSTTNRSSIPAYCESTAIGLSMGSDSDMAWFLAETAGASLTGDERTLLFVELGCGEYHLAIERILNAAIACKATLPHVAIARLITWLDGYVGSPEERRLRALAAAIIARQFEFEVCAERSSL